MTAARSRAPRGFAALDPEARREAGRRGGLAAQATGRAHRFTSATARLAGLKGGRPPNVTDAALGLEDRRAFEEDAVEAFVADSEWPPANGGDE